MLGSDNSIKWHLGFYLRFVVLFFTQLFNIYYLWLLQNIQDIFSLLNVDFFVITGTTEETIKNNSRFTRRCLGRGASVPCKITSVSRFFHFRSILYGDIHRDQRTASMDKYETRSRDISIPEFTGTFSCICRPMTLTSLLNVITTKFCGGMRSSRQNFSLSYKYLCAAKSFSLA